MDDLSINHIHYNEMMLDEPFKAYLKGDWTIILSITFIVVQSKATTYSKLSTKHVRKGVKILFN